MTATNHTIKDHDAARKHLDKCQFALTELAESLNALSGNLAKEAYPVERSPR